MADSSTIKTSDLRLLIVAPLSTVRSTDDEPRVTHPTAPYDTTALFSIFLEGLTGVAPSQDLTSFAGYTTHEPLTIRNKYYSSRLTLWCDELPQVGFARDIGPDLAEWSNNMLSDEAREVRDVIGGVIVILPYSQGSFSAHKTEEGELRMYERYLTCVNSLRDTIEDESGRNLATVIVVQDMTTTSEKGRQVHQYQSDPEPFAQSLEDTCLIENDIFGWEVIPWRPLTKPPNTAPFSTDPVTEPTAYLNDFGEKTGMSRVHEVLEQTNWAVSAHPEFDYEHASTNNSDDFSQPSYKPRIDPSCKNGVSTQSDEFQREIMGLHFALEKQSNLRIGEEAESDEEFQVDQMVTLMNRAAEIRDAGNHLSKQERERYAKTEVQKLMQELSLW
ncbi:hypothetical protein LTS08_003401 [Lithohypha guttulata]|nr:hypothetical protein LTS08_003401 [Lithohypha guttulata]